MTVNCAIVAAMMRQVWTRAISRCAISVELLRFLTVCAAVYCAVCVTLTCQAVALKNVRNVGFYAGRIEYVVVADVYACIAIVPLAISLNKFYCRIRIVLKSCSHVLSVVIMPYLTIVVVVYYAVAFI